MHFKRKGVKRGEEAVSASAGGEEASDSAAIFAWGLCFSFVTLDTYDRLCVACWICKGVWECEFSVNYLGKIRLNVEIVKVRCRECIQKI